MTKKLISPALDNSFCNESFLDSLQEDGYVVVPNVVTGSLLARLRVDLELAIEKDSKQHNGGNFQDYGMVLLCPMYGGAFIDLIEHEPFLKPVESVMGDACIVYSYTSSSMPPHGSNYSNRLHNDCSFTIPDSYVTRLGVLLALDDFTEENGATYVLPGSHKFDTAPTEEYFYANAKRVTMKAGSVWYANQKVWHSGGENNSNHWRHAVTVGFCRAYMKQRIDIPRVMDDSYEATLSNRALQKLGFLAQVPASFDEYYASPEERKFRQRLE